MSQIDPTDSEVLQEVSEEVESIVTTEPFEFDYSSLDQQTELLLNINDQLNIANNYLSDVRQFTIATSGITLTLMMFLLLSLVIKFIKSIL